MDLLGNYTVILFYKRNQFVRVTMVSNKAMSTANTDASMINKLANCKPPVLAKQRMKWFNIHVNLKTWNCGAVRKTMVKVGCSIVWTILLLLNALHQGFKRRHELEFSSSKTLSFIACSTESGSCLLFIYYWKENSCIHAPSL